MAEQKEWRVKYLPVTKQPVVYAGDELIAAGVTEANAYLIVSAVNACIKLNPENPQAVAESISERHEALKLTRDNLQTLSDGAIHYERTFRANLAVLNKVLAKANRKGGQET